MNPHPTARTWPELPPARPELVELIRVRLPMVVPFRTSFGVQTDRDVLLVRVVTTDAEGWGECVTPAAPVYSAEYTDGAAAVLSDHLVPSLGDRDVDAAGLGPALAWCKGHRMAKAALEQAVLDAQLRAAGRSLASYLGATRDRVPAGVSVGIPDGGTSELLDLVAGYREDGYLRIKAKVARGHDVTPMSALRARFGDDLALQVDANAGYDPDDPDDLAALDGLDELGLVQIEQPFAPDRLRDHARHAARWRTPVCLDESITDATRARDAIACGACGLVNIKPGRVGGLHEAVRIHDVCAALDVPVWSGGMLETGVGRAGTVALAALPNMRLPGDTSASSRYFTEDVTEPFVLEDGHLAVPDEPGLGRTPRGEPLRTADRTRLR